MRGNSKKTRKKVRKKDNVDIHKDIKKLPNTRDTSNPYNYYNSQVKPPIYTNTNFSQVPGSRTTRTRQTTSRANNIPNRSSQRPVKRTSNTRRNKKRRTSILWTRILLLIVFIISLVYVVGIVIKTAQKPIISYQTVQMGVIDNSILFNGLIVRDESIVKNTKEGNMLLIAAEGDKVRKNGQVYQVLTGNEAAAIQNDLKKLESDIEKVQIKRKDMSYYQNEIQEIENNITDYIKEYYMVSQDGYIEGTHLLRKNLEYEIEKRKNIHMKDNSDTLTAYKEQKQDLSAKLAKNQHVHRSQQPGIVSYYIDNNEEIFNVDSLKRITENDIKQKYEFISTNMEQTIKEGDPAYKLIKDDKWYVVSFIPESWAGNFKVGQTYDFVLMDEKDTDISLTVADNIPEGKNHRIIFSSREQVEKFSNKRNIEFKSKQHMYEGLKIPVSSVAERNLIKIPSKYVLDSDKGKGVIKIDKDTKESKFISLDIQYEDDEGSSFILQDIENKDSLKIGDIVENQSNKEDRYQISEITTIKGVYVVNGRITKFKQIKIEAQNDNYIIANPNTIQGLKQFDQIVTNPKNTKEKQLLRDLDVKNSR